MHIINIRLDTGGTLEIAVETFLESPNGKNSANFKKLLSLIEYSDLYAGTDCLSELRLALRELIDKETYGVSSTKSDTTIKRLLRYDKMLDQSTEKRQPKKKKFKSLMRV